MSVKMHNLMIESINTMKLCMEKQVYFCTCSTAAADIMWPTNNTSYSNKSERELHTGTD